MTRPTTTPPDRLKYEDIHAILTETCDGLGVGEETRARVMQPPRKIDEAILCRALQTAYQWGLAAAYTSLLDDDMTQEDEPNDPLPPAEETTPQDSDDWPHYWGEHNSDNDSGL